jgi:hypothetical protein
MLWFSLGNSLGVCSIEENTVPRDWEKKFLLQIVVPIEKIVRKNVPYEWEGH